MMSQQPPTGQTWTTPATSTPHRRQPATWLVATAGLIAGLALGVGGTIATNTIIDSTGSDAAAASDDGPGALRAAEESCGARETRVSSDGSSLSMDGIGVGGESIHSLECVLRELGGPDSIMDRIGNTRALDGTLEAEWDGYVASWTYHPDDGVAIVISQR